MIIQLKEDIDIKTLENIELTLQQMQIPHYPVQTQHTHYLVCTPEQVFDIRKIGHLKGIDDVHRVTGSHKLVSAKWRVGHSKIVFDDGTTIGGQQLTIMAGPCSIENAEQVENTVKLFKANGIRFMRGGIYKPRTSPYSFRGLGLEGLKMFHRICAQNGIKIITEVMEKEQIEAMIPYVDIFQVGARNSQNFNLLEALGKVDKPLMIKRGISGTIDELLYSAEYVFKSGNEHLMLCERGIRSFENSYRNTLDLNAIPLLKEKTHLPVIVDPSHGIGLRRHVAKMALAGVAAGADGLIVEIHKHPDEAYTDAQQTIDFTEFKNLVKSAKALHDLLNEA